VTDTNVFQLCQPGSFADPLTEVLRNGARALLMQAVEAEVAALLSSHADKLRGAARGVSSLMPPDESLRGASETAAASGIVQDRRP
jgi:putative transposase